jgi:hypothetical protein
MLLLLLSRKNRCFNNSGDWASLHSVLFLECTAGSGSHYLIQAVFISFQLQQKHAYDPSDKSSDYVHIAFIVTSSCCGLATLIVFMLIMGVMRNIGGLLWPHLIMQVDLNFVLQTLIGVLVPSHPNTLCSSNNRGNCCLDEFSHLLSNPQRYSISRISRTEHRRSTVRTHHPILFCAVGTPAGLHLGDLLCRNCLSLSEVLLRETAVHALLHCILKAHGNS